MRVAFFSPLPPRKSGIADYSEALLEYLRRKLDIEVFDESRDNFDPSHFDAVLYQIGNNQHHAVAYETAVEYPGVVVLHESNLHHLIAELTIRRGDWDAYLREVAYDGGPEALAYAGRVRALEVGPDYEGVPMLRRLVERSKAIIVHSRFMEQRVREAGFTGPVARIHHGAWLPGEAAATGGEAQLRPMEYRHRLGLDETTPLIGIFGFLKPYKRVAESLRAFRRLIPVEPRAKMILCGEEHPDLPLGSLVNSLGLAPYVRRLGFTPIEDFAGYLAACDIAINLRYPTVGETSGTLIRALGLGKAVLVSDVGSFAELPDEICLKVPVGPAEEDLIFEYLNLLVSRPELRRELGRNAQCWAEQECSWERVAGEYASFLEAVVNGQEWLPRETERTPAAPAAHEPAPEGYITSWAGDSEGARAYLQTHITRLDKTLQITPPGGPEDRVLEMGAYLQITPALKTKRGYGEVRGCYFGKSGQTEHRSVTSAEGERFECDIDLFDAERDMFPYPDEHFTTVVCGELIEHLREDPMHMMAEVNRILRPGGHLVLTTPNAASLRAISAILHGYHPGFFPAYIRPARPGEEADARHSREYTAKEVARLLIDSGFDVVLLETGEFRDRLRPEQGWISHLLERYYLPDGLRGDGIYAVGRKTGGIRFRYPDWLYN